MERFKLIVNLACCILVYALAAVLFGVALYTGKMHVIFESVMFAVIGVLLTNNYSENKKDLEK